VSRKWIVIIAVLAIGFIAAVTVVAILVDRDRDEARRAAAIAATSTTGVTSPYDLTELPADTDLDVVEDAAFISILVANAEGKPTSYGVSADLPAAQALTASVRHADEVDAEETGGGGNADTLAFVLPSRETLTFTLDLDRGLVSRGGRVWRPDGDLRALIESAVTTPE
jgi:hypothetical protein